MSWEIKKLSEVCTNIFAGGDVPKDRLSKFKTARFNIPIYSNGEKNKGLYGFTDIARVLEPSITVSARGTIGYSEIRRAPFLPVVRLITLTPNPEQVELEFLKYILKEIKFTNSGVAIPQLTVPMIKEYQCKVPSISEQKRIVAILDEAFEQIDQAKANAEQNLKNAREVFESSLKTFFNNPSWLEKQFEQICVLQRGFDLPTRLRISGENPLISSSGETDRIDQWKVKSPGVATGRSGSIGKVHFIEDNFWPLNTALYIKDFCGNDERFIYYFLTQFKLERFASGAGVPTLNRNHVHSETCKMTNDIKEQKKIVYKLDLLSDKVKELESIYQQKIQALDELKQSLLQKAFNGELTKSADGDAA